jgi:hypothetical protein
MLSAIGKIENGRLSDGEGLPRAEGRGALDKMRVVDDTEADTSQIQSVILHFEALRK